jgi:hypothetical protein
MSHTLDDLAGLCASKEMRGSGYNGTGHKKKGRDRGCVVWIEKDGIVGIVRFYFIKRRYSWYSYKRIVYLTHYTKIKKYNSH